VSQAGPSPDSVRAALREVFADPVYDWREGRAPFDALRRWWEALVERLAALEASHPGVLRAIVWGLVIVLAVIAAHAIWLLVRTVRAAGARAGAPEGSLAAPTRDAGWFRGEADRLARAGRYAAAIQADFVAFVLELDARRVLRFHPSKTPREYVAELAAPDQRRLDFAALVNELYRFAFAGAPCGPAEYAHWRSRAAPERYAAPD
jgi:hypothetical protein